MKCSVQICKVKSVHMYVYKHKANFTLFTLLAHSWLLPCEHKESEFIKLCIAICVINAR